MMKQVEKLIKNSIDIQTKLLESEAAKILKAARILKDGLKKGGKLIIFGNGGSAADSQHIAAEFVGRFKRERGPLAALALTTNTSTLTAVANDFGYDSVFARQLEAVASEGDVIMGLSTSGKSKNVIEALRLAKSKGLTVIGLTGCGGGVLPGLCDLFITVDSCDTPRIQETHILIGHIIVEIVEGD